MLNLDVGVVFVVKLFDGLCIVCVDDYDEVCEVFIVLLKVVGVDVYVYVLG